MQSQRPPPTMTLTTSDDSSKRRPPRNQGMNDRRVIPQLIKDYSMRTLEAFSLPEKIHAAVEDPTLVINVSHVNFGISILTPSSVKTLELLEDSLKLKSELGATEAAHQEN